MKKKIILSSVLSIVLCLSLIAGATFALFTSEARVNIAVTSGKVLFTATLTDLQTKSLGKDMPAGEFEVGGTAAINGDTLELDLMVPGDEAIVTIDIDNQSNVAIQYCVKLIGTGELVGALTAYATVDGQKYMIGGAENTTEWITVDANTAIDDITVSVLMASTVGNAYQDKSADIAIQIIAIQANADQIGLAQSFADGGVITSGGVPNSIDNVTDENGTVVAGLTVGEKAVTLEDIVLTKTVAGTSSYAITTSATSGALTLNAGATVKANEFYGVLVTGGSVVMNEGSNISVSGVAAAGLYIQPTADVSITLDGTITAADGAAAIYVDNAAGAQINIYVADQAAYDAYSAVVVNPGASAINWYIAGTLVP